MWVKAIKDFRNKETKEKIKKGQKLNFKKERAEDCINRGLVTEVKTEKKETE